MTVIFDDLRADFGVFSDRISVSLRTSAHTGVVTEGNACGAIRFRQCEALHQPLADIAGQQTEIFFILSQGGENGNGFHAAWKKVLDKRTYL